MSGEYIVSDFKKRIAIWALGQALPETSALKPYVHAVILSVVAASAAGTLMVISFISALAAVFYYFNSSGIDTETNFLILAAFTLSIGLVAYLYAKNKISNMGNLSKSLSLFSAHTDVAHATADHEEESPHIVHEAILLDNKEDVEVAVGETVNAIIGGFWEGFREKEPIIKD